MAIQVEGLSHTYGANGPDPHQALYDIHLTIPQGIFMGLVGHTGSGKSTLIQTFNGLVTPTQGRVLVDGLNLADSSPQAKAKRLEVGLVFQYPEYQLFEETVAKDVAFGPKNQGLDEAGVEARVREAMALVDLDYEGMKDASPFQLSGGQKRRVAIAGILAMKPRYLILDEPTAGLDPGGRDTILDTIARIHKEEGITVVLVSHRMDDVMAYCDHMAVLDKGQLVAQGKPEDVFQNYDQMRAIGLGVPQVTDLFFRLQRLGAPVPTDVYDLERAREVILETLRRREEDPC